MRYSVLSAPIACSLALHFAVLHFGWEVFASDAGVSVPWRQPALRATLVSAHAAEPVNTAAAPVFPPAAPGLAHTPSQPLPRPALPPVAVVEPPPAAPPAAETQPAEMPDSAFMDQGGVDQMARPLVEPEYSATRTVTHWVVEFDLLIDASGKVVRVANISKGAPRDIVGAVLQAFYTIPYEPAKLAGRPVAIRQRFSVQPDSGQAGGAKVIGEYNGAQPVCVGGC